MVDLTRIEKRLTSVEVELAELRRRVGASKPAGDWVEQLSGSLADLPEDDYQTFLDCCREAREEISANAPEAEQP